METLSPLKACNDWRHFCLRNVNEGHCRLLKACNGWRHFCLRNACRLPYRASLHATRHLSLMAEMRLFCSLAGRRWHLREGCRWPHWSLRVIGLACLWLMKGADNHKVCSRATWPLDHDSEIETFLRSWPEDFDNFGKGVDDHIGLWMSTGSLASS